FSLGSAFLDGLGGRFNQSLGFAETQAGDGTDFLDDVDLVVAERGENNVEFGLFFSGSSRSSTAGGSNGNRSSGGNAPLFFQHLRQFGSFQNGQGRQVVNDFGEIGHLINLSFSGVQFKPAQKGHGITLLCCSVPHERPTRARYHQP